MVDKLLNFALIGGEPILYLMIAISLLSVAVIIERLVVYALNRIDLGDFSAEIVRLLNDRKVEDALFQAQKKKSAEARVIEEGLKNFDKGATVAGELMESMGMKQQQQLDKRLTILGTVGSNAPFIGLLGTVLGIIKAFNDLAFNTEGGPSVVMGGIAEALVATAVGLLVAIPAVVFFNFFKNRQKQIMGNIAQLQKMLIAFIDDVQSEKSSPEDVKQAA